MDQTSMTLLQGLLISCLDGKLSTALHIGLHRLMDPLTRGDFPSSMRTIVKNRLPEFTKNQSEMSKASFDFTGINYSTTLYSFDDAKPNFHAVRTGIFGYRSFRNKLHDNTRIPVILLASLATGLRENSCSMHSNPVIYITENAKLDGLFKLRLPLVSRNECLPFQRSCRGR
ncbi:unnamed protein product [Musa acuminata subsp. malaccensis]|uniref:(wild Malaysian banana) hypothetical protein n=1 Tax=Musa acuminata subsp. malaccensis TaxID=214687 RepID=A0A804J8R5_MUSAM|nr:unnamed protein product [Musa acuminata subsp. malaccensis]